MMPAQNWEEVRRWRKLTRERLIEHRTALAPAVRRSLGERACAALAQAVDLRPYEVLGFCWPIRGEFDVREVAKRHLAGGGRLALPVVVEKSAPVEFWRWYPGMAMQTGFWNIPIPKRRELLVPQAVIVPLVGFDESGYRLGYGGGYFDRTLAAASPRPFAIGFGYADSRLATIHPQPHDIPMNLIVTDEGSLVPGSNPLPGAGGYYFRSFT
ncbi:MAG: 5-formyltetrahydrofolate cyclo-ligase [Steroidobacteraceae bacterium]|jgi:5-formyltetrahydrofolate cyclo-ligase|nr:5-formyltetrahydrofolate cyclo-ligase [Steroidobacteraceae bacterium]